MSLDLTLLSEPFKCCGNEIIAGHFSYTYNVSQMWYEIYPDDEGMVAIDNMSGEDAARKLVFAISEMKLKKPYMITLNPDNGWGGYDGFLKFLINIFNASLKNPDFYWVADR